MPVRVLDAEGQRRLLDDCRGHPLRRANGAQVINLSIEFSPGTTSPRSRTSPPPPTYAARHGVVLVGASGNDEDNLVDYPAALADGDIRRRHHQRRMPGRLLDVGSGLDLVAPGGGNDVASVPGSVCHPTRNLPDIYQMTFNNPSDPGAFSLPNGWYRNVDGGAGRLRRAARW